MRPRPPNLDDPDAARSTYTNRPRLRAFGCKARGGSSPLGRITKALHSGAFFMAGEEDLVRVGAASRPTPQSPLNGPYSGSFPRPRRPSDALLSAARSEPVNGLRNHRPSGPGALPATRPPDDSARSTPCCGLVERRGARKPSMRSNTQTAAITAMVTTSYYPQQADSDARSLRAINPALCDRRWSAAGLVGKAVAPGSPVRFGAMLS
jgi:hypothetical protein